MLSKLVPVSISPVAAGIRLFPCGGGAAPAQERVSLNNSWAVDAGEGAGGPLLDGPGGRV